MNRRVWAWLAAAIGVGATVGLLMRPRAQGSTVRVLPRADCQMLWAGTGPYQKCATAGTCAACVPPSACTQAAPGVHVQCAWQ